VPDEQLTHPLPPVRSEARTADRRAEFQAAVRPSPEAERLFVASKLQMLRTHPEFHPNDRDAAVRVFRDQIGGALSEDLKEEGVDPIPGGVGYGVFYNSVFKAAFATGTSMSWEIICPSTPGGNVSTWLYVTATNRSSKGVEAFVAYQGQNNFTFNVFDWARAENDRWQIQKPFGNLGDYLGNESANGTQCQVLVVMNTTSQDTPGNWTNEVWLLNLRTNQWDLVYRYSYPATLQDQTGDWVGSWGPIVETFQDAYAGTNILGALKTQILGRDAAGTWGAWGQLTDAQSDIRVDNKGFVQLFVNKNYSWAVQS
jgi:hypothetical protein